MKHSLIIGQRVLRELSKDKRLFGLSIVGPFILIYLLKIFIDSMPPNFPAARYAMPFAAFIVHFFSFILCGIVLVQERTAGTLERMFIAGFSRPSIIGGYVLGYFGLVTLQATVVLGETVWLSRFRLWGQNAAAASRHHLHVVDRIGNARYFCFYLCPTCRTYPALYSSRNDPLALSFGTPDRY